MLGGIFGKYAWWRGSEGSKPIDVVYTWVDGADPEFQRELRQYAIDDRDKKITGARRFRNSEELRYSLRSLETNVPWAGRVFLVTNGQVPGWLRKDHPRLRLVKHREIFPDVSHLPTFNSAAIESHLYRIPKISRQFLYLNDDMFFGRPVALDNFITEEGQTRLWIDAWELPFTYTENDDLVIQWLGYNRDLLEKKSGRRRLGQPAHGPILFDRKALARMKVQWADEFARTSALRFRAGKMAMVHALYTHWFFEQGKGKFSVSSEKDFPLVMFEPPLEQIRDKLEKIRHTRPLCFCINDDWDGDTETKNEILGRFLEDYFPQPSSFER